MADLLDLAIAGAAGYVYSELSDHSLRKNISQRLNGKKQNSNKNLRDIIREYAQAHGVYTQNNELAYELHKIATEYQEYDYEDFY